MQNLARRRPKEMAAVRGLGLSGQMHGATLVDGRGEVLRPAILWNDGRSAAACKELERREPRSREITGNLAMPGFTAPKLVWLEEHEPELFRAAKKVLLPKDYLRWRLCGDYVSDMSDAAGTLWLDVGRRQWSAEMLDATHLDEQAMPRLVEGSEVSGVVRAEHAKRWGMGSEVVIAGGGGDNAAGAVGVGVVQPGSAFLSLGTSGVLFAAGDSFAPNPARAAHAFCHALPGRWHQMSVILSAASCLSWVCSVLGGIDEASLLQEVEASGEGSNVIFLPYLSGERTPHNDASARGMFFGLTHDTTRAALGRSVLEGVAFAFADGRDVLTDCGTVLENISVIGGGARSQLWGRILASVLDQPLDYHVGGERGAAFGAARLARLAATGEDPGAVCVPPEVDSVVTPVAEWVDRYAVSRELYQKAYLAVRQLYPDFAKMEGAAP